MLIFKLTSSRLTHGARVRTDEESGMLLVLSFMCVTSLKKSLEKNSHVISIDLGKTLLLF